MNLLSVRIELPTSAVSGRDTSMVGRLWRPLLAAGVGIALLAGVGFAPAATLHDAAHDGRHGFTFPCH